MTTRLVRAGAALGALLVVAIGVPVALARWGRWPITGLPSWEQTSDLPSTIVSDSAVFGVLTLLAWAAWSLFLASVLLEIAANVSGRDAPRIPLAGALQRNARHLVAALLMTASVVGPLTRSASSQSLPSTATPQAGAGSEDPVPAVDLPPAPAADSDVQAPVEGPQIEVRRGDSPWELAERHLGDPMRWREIWELNEGRPQPDGGSWVTADLIEPGWRLVLPGDARHVEAVASPSPYIVEPGDTLSEIAAEHLGDADRATEILDLNEHHPQPDGDSLTDPDLIRPGWQLELPAPSGTAPAAPAPAPPPAPPEPLAPPAAVPPSTAPTSPTSTAPGSVVDPVSPSEQTVERAERDVDDDADRTPVGLLGGGVAAAGLLYLLERRRRAQHRRRHRGGPPPVAPAELQQFECLLRATAQPDPAAAVDAALRAVTAGGEELSDLSHVEALSEQVTLVLRHAGPAPAGFANETAERWRTAVGMAELEALGAGAAPPLPALCPIGTAPDGCQYLVDLESTPVTTIVGDPDVATDMLASMAAALTTAPWSGHQRIITVGIDTVRTLPPGTETADTIGAALRTASARAAAADEALAELGLTTTTDARAVGTTPDSWDPVIVLCTVPPSDAERELIELVSPHRAVAVCTVSGVPLGRVLTLEGDGSVRLGGVDTTLIPNRLRTDEAADVARLLDHAAVDPPSPAPNDLPAPTRLPVTEPGRMPDDESLPTASDDIDVLVRVLGEVEAVRLGRHGEERLNFPKQRALEAIAYLALREASVDREDVQAALWPDGANSAKTFSNAMWEARRTLGTDANGGPLLPDASAGRYALSERVVTDYGQFCELVTCADATDDAEEAAALLTEALRLVRGEPFVGVGRSYAWVGPHRGMIVAQILDAAEELAEVHLATGDWRAAEWAARQGLRAMPCDERMYRVLMRAAHSAGNTASVHRAFKELCDAVADPDTGAEPDDTVHPDTVALLEQLTSSATQRRVTA